MCADRRGRSQHLAAHDLVRVDSAEQQSRVIAGDRFIQQTVILLDVAHDGRTRRPEADELNGLTLADPPRFDPTGRHGATPFDGVDTFHRHEKRPVDLALRLRHIRIERHHRAINGNTCRIVSRVTSAGSALPRITGTSSPGNPYFVSSSRTSSSTRSSSSGSSTRSTLFMNTMIRGTPTCRASRMCSRSLRHRPVRG